MGEIQAITMSSWFDDMLGDIKYAPDSEAGKLYPFFVRVGCIKRRPPRHPFFSMFVDVGYGIIDKIMFHEELDMSYLAFVFPERWLGVAEQQAFSHVMARHPEVENFKEVNILTSSPMIVGSFMAEQIRVITWEEDKGVFDGRSENR